MSTPEFPNIGVGREHWGPNYPLYPPDTRVWLVCQAMIPSCIPDLVTLENLWEASTAVHLVCPTLEMAREKLRLLSRLVHDLMNYPYQVVVEQHSRDEVRYCEKDQEGEIPFEGETFLGRIYVDGPVRLVRPGGNHFARYSVVAR